MTATYIELGNAGRMGNCFFQIAATIGYAKKHNVPFIFPKWEYQNQLNIPQEFFTDREFIDVKNDCPESGFSYSEIPFKENCSLSGYFQSWKYFDNCKEYIETILSPPPVEDLKDYCCVHVRRGDYLNFPLHHPTQPMQYYMKAIRKIPINKFMVFSDDPEWCKNNFKDSRFTINETGSVICDFSKMISCSHHIIANSSFSWWAAWLCKNKNKVVVAPSNWFGPMYRSYSTADLIPSRWIIK